MKKGYNKTTYQDIADASGKERTNIQFYYPKKDLLVVDFLNRLLDHSTEYIKVKNLKTDDNFAGLYTIGQIYFSFLLNHRKLTLEVLSDRTITEKILFLNEDWTYQFLDTDPTIKNEELTEDIVMSLGGAYEVMYRNMVNGKSVNVPRLLKKVVIIFMSSLGYERNLSDSLLSKYNLSEETLSDSNSFLIAALLSESD